MRSPNMFVASPLLAKQLQQTQKETKPRKWVPARPESGDGRFSRWWLAWCVLTGHMDALLWIDQ